MTIDISTSVHLGTQRSTFDRAGDALRAADSDGNRQDREDDPDTAE